MSENLSEARTLTERMEDLVPRLLDEDEHAAYKAAFEMHRLGRPALERALELARDPRPRMRAMACCVLGQVFDESAPDRALAQQGLAPPVFYRDGVPVLLKLLENDPEPDVRSAAADALGHQELPRTLPNLCRAAGDPSAEVRCSVAGALGSSYGGWEDPEALGHRCEVITALLRLMDDEDDDVRDWATFSMHLGDHDTPEVRARFWRALDDPYPDVRGEAVVGLVRLGERGVAARLAALLREGPISPCYFEAAEELGDPALLPAVLEGAERWGATLAEGEQMHSYITSAIQALGGAPALQGED